MNVVQSFYSENADVDWVLADEQLFLTHAAGVDTFVVVFIH